MRVVCPYASELADSEELGVTPIQAPPVHSVLPPRVGGFPSELGSVQTKHLRKRTRSRGKATR